MNPALLEQIVNAVLYEGYILYPYRPSSKKNSRERFTFGRVYPDAYRLARNGAEPSLMQTECLVEASDEQSTLEISVRFLQPMLREIGVVEGPGPASSQAEPHFRIVPELRVGKELFQSWQEAVERRVEAPPFELHSAGPNLHQVPFHFPPSRSLERLFDGQQLVGVVVRRLAEIAGTIEVLTDLIKPGLFKITARILNQTAIPAGEQPPRESILLRTFASTHTVLRVQGAEFVSLMDPPARCQSAAQLCKNVGTWPVLVGTEQDQERDTMLSSPIILYDYPKIAPESAGPLFDGTEIDEILTLRILTMTAAEKLEMSRVDEQARRLLERTERLPQESLLELHGAMRRTHSDLAQPAPRAGSGCEQPQIEFDDFFGAGTRLEGVSVGGAYLRAGDRVRIKPKARADVMDLALSGQTAIVEAVEQDAERRIHLAVVLEKDPGKDLGFLRQPGHRFFYGIDEVELVAKDSQ